MYLYAHDDSVRYNSDPKCSPRFALQRALCKGCPDSRVPVRCVTRSWPLSDYVSLLQSSLEAMWSDPSREQCTHRIALVLASDNATLMNHWQSELDATVFAVYPVLSGDIAAAHSPYPGHNLVREQNLLMYRTLLFPLFLSPFFFP